MKKFLIVTALLAVSSPSVAQTSRCGWELGKWVCRTEQPPTFNPHAFRDSYNRSYQQTVQQGEALRQAQAARDAQSQAQTNQNNSRTVGEMVAAGNCEGAKRYALLAGDLGLAGQVDQVCQARPQPTSPY